MAVNHERPSRGRRRALGYGQRDAYRLAGHDADVSATVEQDPAAVLGLRIRGRALLEHRQRDGALVFVEIGSPGLARQAAAQVGRPGLAVVAGRDRARVATVNECAQGGRRCGRDGSLDRGQGLLHRFCGVDRRHCEFRSRQLEGDAGIAQVAAQGRVRGPRRGQIRVGRGGRRQHGGEVGILAKGVAAGVVHGLAQDGRVGGARP